MNEFNFEPSELAPFRDVDVLNKIRAISREELANHPNKDLTIRIVRDNAGAFIQFSDIIARIRDTA